MEVLPGLHQVHPGLGSCNVFLWEKGGGLVLIDAGLDLDADAVLDAVRHQGSKPADLTHILVTHRHGDHVGGLGRLRQATGAQIGAHEEDAASIEAGGQDAGANGTPSASGESIVMPRRSPVPVDLPFHDGAELPGGLVAVHTSGHTPGHTCFYHRGRRFLLLGDALFNFPPLTGPVTAFSWDIERARESVLRLLDLDVGALGFGHGPPILKDPAGELQSLLQAATD